MAGQSAGQTIESVRGAISSIKEMGGISEMETSAVGGAGRKGGNAEGGPQDWAPHKNICDEFMAKRSGNASTGQTGPNSGNGKTF